MEFSTELNEIFGALAKFRKEVVQPKKDKNNPQFRSKYVDLDNVTHSIDKVAPSYGLAYVQNVQANGDTVSVQTIVTHESGQYIKFDPLDLDARPVVKGGARGQVTSHSAGSAITYGRRYTLSSAFGIASEVDDDGNDASGGKQTQPQSQPNQANDLINSTLANMYPFFEQKGIPKLTFFNGLASRLGVKDIYQSQQSDIINAGKLWQEELTKEEQPTLEKALQDTKDKHDEGGNWYE